MIWEEFGSQQAPLPIPNVKIGELRMCTTAQLTLTSVDSVAAY